MNISDYPKLKFFGLSRLGNNYFIVASFSIGHSLQVTLLAPGPELNFKPFLIIHRLINENFSLFAI
jgi:hypothetical protein